MGKILKNTFKKPIQTPRFSRPSGSVKSHHRNGRSVKQLKNTKNPFDEMNGGDPTTLKGQLELMNGIKSLNEKTRMARSILKIQTADARQGIIRNMGGR